MRFARVLTINPITLTQEDATVYRVGRRRYLSRKGAMRAMAAMWIRERCVRERGSSDAFASGFDDSYCCKYHDPMRHTALMDRLTRLARKYIATPSALPSPSELP